MTRDELLKSERPYYDKLTQAERRIYLADNKRLAMLNVCTDEAVKSFVDVAQLLHELNRLHERYNLMLESLFSMPNEDAEQQKLYEAAYEVQQELFSAVFAIGDCAAVLSLMNMDECDALYGYLATLKMRRFDILCDCIDAGSLIRLMDV